MKSAANRAKHHWIYSFGSANPHGASGTTKNITAQYHEEIPPRFSSPSGDDKIPFVKYTFPLLSFQ
ncbi:hypothetical protein CSP26_20890 [Salmonella enterica subsp. indica]|nr:hypothetical protein [Salmonella enterica subsp. indica]ECI8270982.1 hypothetical protein [Salmonella enterica subsp. enterica]